MKRFMKNLFGIKTAKPARSSKPHSFRPRVEQLERREVLSAFTVRPPIAVGAAPQLAALGHSKGLDNNTCPFATVTYRDNEGGVSVPRGGPQNFASADQQWLNADQKRRAEQLISIFENDTTEIQYGYWKELNDGRGITAGRAGFTSATGDLYEVVSRYTKLHPDNPLAPYLPRLKELADAHSSDTSGLDGMREAFVKLATNKDFQQVQNDVQDEFYYRPAMTLADQVGLKTALARAVLYDTLVVHGDGTDPDGAPALIQQTNDFFGGSPATGVDEGEWLVKFLEIRREDLLNPHDGRTKDEWAAGVGRVDVLKMLVDQGNWDLDGPIYVVHVGPPPTPPRSSPSGPATK